MTIDVHCHFYRKGFMSDSYWQLLSRFTAEDMGRLAGLVTSPERVEKDILPTWWDDTGEVNIRRMDEAGIEKTVLLAADVGLLSGEGEIDIEEQHKQIADVARRHPDRFIFAPNIDPRRPGSLDLLEKCVMEWDARALKLYPPAGFNPDDEICLPFLDRLSAWNMPLLVHTGAAYGYREGCHPARLERILADFPKLTVVACHLGGNWWREMIALGQVRENLVTNFSGFQVTVKGSYGRFCHILRKFLSEMGRERVLFGTDAPVFEHVLPSRDWVQLIKSLPKDSPEGIPFTEEEVSAVLHGNAERIFYPE